MKFHKIALITFISVISITFCQAQYDWGVGFRIGDPSGVTVKRYLGDNAFEISLGRTHGFYGDGYYNNRFDDWYDNRDFNYRNYRYLGFKSSTPIGLQVHYLFHQSIDKLGNDNISGLSWYYGFGGQIRTQTYRYDYQYQLRGDPNWYTVRGEKVTDLDLGVDGVVGLEYTFDDVPISIFLDLTLFAEVVDDPFDLWLQGGLGARYNF